MMLVRHVVVVRPSVHLSVCSAECMESSSIIVYIRENYRQEECKDKNWFYVNPAEWEHKNWFYTSLREGLF